MQLGRAVLEGRVVLHPLQEGIVGLVVGTAVVGTAVPAAGTAVPVAGTAVLVAGILGQTVGTLGWRVGSSLGDKWLVPWDRWSHQGCNLSLPWEHSETERLDYRKISNTRRTKFQNLLLISSCSCLCPIHLNQVSSR